MLVFDELQLQGLQNSLFKPAADGPPTLYHYTSLDTLQKIVETKQLFVTDVRFMNDASELHHAATVVNHVFKKRIIPREHAMGLISMLTDLSIDAVCYVGCFSEKASRLSQWRAYTKVGSGVSIGFSTEKLQERATGRGFELGKCVYNKHDQRDIAERLLKCVRDVREPQHGEFAFESVSAVLRIASLLKNPAFAEEQEWRIVSTDNKTVGFNDVFFRAGRHMLIPHLFFELPTGEPETFTENSLEVNDIVLGPTVNDKLSLYSLRRFLSKQGVWNMKGNRLVRPCGIPLREM